MNLKPYITTPENADKITDWLRTRGGIAIRTEAAGLIMGYGLEDEKLGSVIAVGTRADPPLRYQ